MTTFFTYLSFLAFVFMAVTVLLALRHRHQHRYATPQVRRADGWLATLHKRNTNSRVTFFVVPIVTLLFFSSTAGFWMLLCTAVVWYYGHYQGYRPPMRTAR